MKIIFTFIAFCFFTYGYAQLNTDTVPAAKGKFSSYDERANRAQDHLHPKFPNLANPSGPGYDGDGAVFRNEAIVNRHIHNINDLVK